MEGAGAHHRLPAAEWRDPWLTGAFFAPFLLLLLVLGGRPGEPVADDYDHLYQVLLVDHWSWFDGGGSAFYWRPLGRQAYYGIFAPLMLAQPWAVAVFNVICLCTASALIYRSFRTTVEPYIAFAVSTAPWMMESSRLLILWPGCFQDLGALLFVALALHEAVARRLWTFLGAGLAAVLCKEVASVALIAVLACPLVQVSRPHERRRWYFLTGVLLAAWSIVYVWVYARASLTIPGSGGPWAWPSGIALIPWWLLKAILSLPPTSGRIDALIVAAVLAVLPWSRVKRAILAPERRRWWIWGAIWTVPLALMLVPIYPSWGPYRCALVAFGVTAAAMITLGALHRHALTAFLLVRLLLMVLAPKPVSIVAENPPMHGASIDVPLLSRLQCFLADVRGELQRRYPRLPPGAVVVHENFPEMTQYAFGSRPALHVWYRDTTLQWVPISTWLSTPSLPVATVVEYQANRRDEVALVDPAAMRALIQATSEMNDGRCTQSLASLARAESLLVDTTAVVFRDSVRGKRHYVLAQLDVEVGRYHEARSELLALLALFPRDVPGRQKLATVDSLLSQGSAGGHP